jgi:hypothetical protein
LPCFRQGGGVADRDDDESEDAEEADEVEHSLSVVPDSSSYSSRSDPDVVTESSEPSVRVLEFSSASRSSWDARA